MGAELLRADQLFRASEPNHWPEVEEAAPFVGQERAVEMVDRALELGAGAGHVVVIAPPGYGRRALVRWVAKQKAGVRKAGDLVLLPRLSAPRNPQVVRLAAGRGCALVAAVDRLFAELTEVVEGAGGWKQRAREGEEGGWEEEEQTIANALQERFAAVEAACSNAEEVVAASYLRELAQRVVERMGEWLVWGEEGMQVNGAWFRGIRPVVLRPAPPEGKVPVVEVAEPVTYEGLVGWIERDEEGVGLEVVRPGALVLGCEGFVLLDAESLVADRSLWFTLRGILTSDQIAIVPPPGEARWGGRPMVQPDPIPFGGQVVLWATPEAFEALAADEMFLRLFPWAVELEILVRRTAAVEKAIARRLAELAAAQVGREVAFEKGALAAAIEALARSAEDQERLSLRLGSAVGILTEAAVVAQRRGSATVGRAEVEHAVKARWERLGVGWRETLQAIERGELAIAVSGSKVGQVNGLVVFAVGEQAYGHPVRITATVRVGGEGEVIDVERETELGGAVHSKGVLILSAFLAGYFAKIRPLALTASVAIEQSYGPVDGDSASLAEALALLSTIGEVPLKQAIAVTGSINQLGAVQAVGGVNEKIEGWFAVCAARGFPAEAGVIIPAANVSTLMLRREVVEAAQGGYFRVWAVRNVEEAAALLSGLPEHGPQSLFARVSEQLARFARYDERGEGDLWRRPWARSSRR
ncbi:MAG: AAA family ATPase [Hydrogenophilus sp.]|nr:AAA family ATPase [Hydrogenophilus sp.]